jgi:outer membrane biosynthesis protein TonB
MVRGDMAAPGLLPNGKPVLLVPLTGSLLLHAVLIALFLLLRPGQQPPSPPVYRVDLVAAPAGERAAGVVKPTPPTAAPQAPPIRPKTAPHEMPLPDTKLPKRAATPDATPTPPTVTKPDTKTAPTAGGGEAGGRGTDVVTVNTGGIDFPYTGYLENIIRQIAKNFKPSSRGALRAEVFFMINRDGSVPLSSIHLVTRSGVYSFDADAQGAVEAAARAGLFGPLPAGFTQPVLPVTFRFDPQLSR